MLRTRFLRARVVLVVLVVIVVVGVFAALHTVA
jgi:hypothetical protein